MRHQIIAQLKSLEYLSKAREELYTTPSLHDVIPRMDWQEVNIVVKKVIAYLEANQ